MENSLEMVFAQLSNNAEYGVKYKGASTPLSLIKNKDGSFMLHGFFDRSDKDINSLVQNFVFDKASGEVVHYKGEEDYCSINFNKSQTEEILKESKYFIC